jgi:hypothetical protein
VALNTDWLERIVSAGAAVADRSAAEVAADEGYWRDIQQAFTPRPHHHQPQQRVHVPKPARRPRSAEALSRLVEPGADPFHVEHARA